MSYRNVFYYDSRRNLTCVRDSDLGLTYYTYDAGSRMTSVKNPFGEVTYYEYRLDNQVEKRILGNGCVTYYEYDNIGRTSRVENRKGDGSMISSFDYVSDAVGNPISIEREDGYTVYYEYDARHQLTRETHVDEGEAIYAWEWDYDAAGNREFQVFNGEATYYEYNAGNELTIETKDGQTTYYHYDRCGNTTAKQELAGTTYYHWDYENLLTQIDLPDGAHNYFAYDADGKRVSKRDSEGFTEFIYQGPNMLALQMERDEAGETQVQYTMGAGLESMRRAHGGDIESGDSSFYHYDWLGSTQELTDEAQAVTDTYRYNAWGEVLERTGITNNAHTWHGGARYYVMVENQLCLLGLRYYSATSGRFVSCDPLPGQPQYQYASARSTAYIDASGCKPTKGYGVLGHARYSPYFKEPSRVITPPAPWKPWELRPEDLSNALGFEFIKVWLLSQGYTDAWFLWNHWTRGTGLKLELPIDRMDRELGGELSMNLMREARHVRDEVRRLRLGPGQHRLVSEEMYINELADNQNWHNALGSYWAYGIADVCVAGGYVDIDLTLWRWDPFEFDTENLPYRPPGSWGHAHTVGLANDYVSEGKQTGKFKYPL